MFEIFRTPKFDFMRVRGYAYAFSALILGASIFFLGWHAAHSPNGDMLNYGIDFRGGSLFQVGFQSAPDMARLRELREVLPHVETVLKQRRQAQDAEAKVAGLARERQELDAKIGERTRTAEQARQTRAELQKAAAADEQKLREAGEELRKLESVLERVRQCERQRQVLAQQVVFSPTPFFTFRNFDQWDGYPLARQRVLDFLRNRSARDSVVLTGDIHSTGVGWVPSVMPSPNDPSTFSEPVAAEFVATGISSNGLPSDVADASAFYERYRQRHYVGQDENPDGVTLAARAIDDGAAARTLARLVSVSQAAVETGA